MSNRTLIEFNHDFTGYIEREPQEFAKALTRYAASGLLEDAEALRHWGLNVFGMRHHSDGYGITWGSIRASQSGRTLPLAKLSDVQG